MSLLIDLMLAAGLIGHVLMTWREMDNHKQRTVDDRGMHNARINDLVVHKRIATTRIDNLEAELRGLITELHKPVIDKKDGWPKNDES